jgi:hypothetical protein
MKEISDELYAKLEYLGIIQNEVRSHNVGKSNYSKKTIQPWTLWLDYTELTPWDDDIIKRVLRIKEEECMSANEARKMDYEKIIHNCQERIRQIDLEIRYKNENTDNTTRVVYPRKVLCTKTWNLNDGDKLVESFTENFYYNQPNKNIVFDNMGRKLYVDLENFNKYFKV